MEASSRSSSACFSSSCLLSIIHFLCFSLLAFAINKNNDTDRLALLELKSKITDPFGAMSSWNSTLHFCQWHHVTCGRRHQRVTILDLNSLKLSGSISPHVGNLSFLKKLSLQNNSFSHEIPTEIGRLRKLQILSLYNNSFGGQIPASISNCSNLVIFFLKNNINLVGRIPVELGSLLKLKEISLSNNNLTGTLPPSLGNISSLQLLHARKNNLHGAVPDTLGQLMNLRSLTLSANQFSGTIPPSFFNLSLIELFEMAYNNFEGSLPLSLGVSLPNLQFFSFSFNQFTGSIPTSISNASSLEVLQLSGNSFTGTVPSLEKLHRLTKLVVSQNNLGSGEADDLKFLSTLTNATNFRGFGLDQNNFGGKLPEKLCNFSRKLQKIYIQENQISGNIPSSISDCVSLETLIADENNLSGSIPTSMGKLLNLGQLFLRYNDFSGFIPSSVGNMSNLIYMDLSENKLRGMIPSSLGYCKNLLKLDLSNNNLSGPIPPQIFGSFSLSLGLDLSKNHLSGSIPPEVGNSKTIGFLSLSENRVSGGIPNDLSSCTSLEFLDLGANLLQGSIPSSLSSLRSLRILNLSRNMFSGKIPEFLKGFSSLEFLDLSYNDFEGIVPKVGVFKNVTAISVAGNENLCGGIPDLRLPPCNELQQSKRGLTIQLKIIISTASAIVGAILVMICLILCMSTNRKRESLSKSDHGNDHELMQLSYQSLFKATNGFSSDNLIGSGSSGSVYKGILDPEGIVIAVKVFKLTNQEASKSFTAECEVLRKVRHRNLVKVFTACSSVDYHGNDFKALVYEFMVNGSLDDWLHPTLGLEEAPRTLNVIQKLNIAIDIACALEYLQHHCGTPIIHCDLKPSNILLNEEMTALVCDFGLVKFTSDCSTDQSSSIGVRGTIGYCPPEYGMGSQASTSGDIFSFGILLLEMFTGKRPTDHIFEKEMSLCNFVKRALPEQVMQILDPNNNLPQMQPKANATSVHDNLSLGNMRNNMFIECLISIFEIGISCSTELPQERMVIGDVVSQLSSIRDNLLGTQLP